MDLVYISFLYFLAGWGFMDILHLLIPSKYVRWSVFALYVFMSSLGYVEYVK